MVKKLNIFERYCLWKVRLFPRCKTFRHSVGDTRNILNLSSLDNSIAFFNATGFANLGIPIIPLPNVDIKAVALVDRVKLIFTALVVTLITLLRNILVEPHPIRIVAAANFLVPAVSGGAQYVKSASKVNLVNGIHEIAPYDF